MKSTLILFAAALLCSSAGAQSVWRCGADGRSYSDSPCPGGRVVAVADERSADQQAAAEGTATRERRLASQLAHERTEREREARAAGNGLAAIGPFERPQIKSKSLPLAKAHPKKPRQRPAAPDTFRAVAAVSR